MQLGLLLLCVMLAIVSARAAMRSTVRPRGFLSGATRSLSMSNGVKNMNVKQFNDVLKSDARNIYQIIDVREKDELEIASIKGTDIMNLALQDAGSWSPKIENGTLLDNSKPTIVFCHHGGRSMRVAQFLVNKGFNEVYNVDGGIHQFSVQVDPSINQY